MVSVKTLGCAFAMANIINLGGSNIAAAVQVCPSAVIKMIIPNPAGGPGDLVARILGEKASADLGQPIVIENRAGATTTIGTNFVAKSKPDGCTILSLTASGVVISVLRDNLGYNLGTDFIPIVSVGSFPMVLAVPVSSSTRTFADLVALARSKEGLVYGTGGTGSLAHLSSVRLINELGGTGTHVPFRGNSDALQGLLGGHVQLFFASSAEALPLVHAGKIRVLGVTSDERLQALPEVPTMKEVGFSDFMPRLWFAFLAPASTPATTVAKLHDALSSAAKDASVRERLKALGFAPETKEGAALSSFMEAEAARWGKIVRENKITSSD